MGKMIYANPALKTKLLSELARGEYFFRAGRDASGSLCVRLEILPESARAENNAYWIANAITGRAWACPDEYVTPVSITATVVEDA